ncbi:hypothetical protein DKX38_022002 [Salix brachista]|uniref:Endoplasmic reticulum transmembrane protein n=1 Tax=Salix brachista TaxID=2182728 RepID=A0A5N5K372_9ROSI|nr:hypothetical protein DKX38_022002 [Salix brachista]
MGLQWMILTYVVAAEAAIAALLTLPSPKLLKGGLVSLISLLLQPALFIVPFSGFLLLGLFFVSFTILLFSFRLYKFWVMKCGDDFSLFIECLKLCWILVVTSVIASKVLCIYKFTPLGFGCLLKIYISLSLRFAVQIYKAQGNAILCVSACLLYWCVYRICKFYKEIQSLEEVEKRFKNQ